MSAMSNGGACKQLSTTRSNATHIQVLEDLFDTFPAPWVPAIR